MTMLGFSISPLAGKFRKSVTLAATIGFLFLTFMDIMNFWHPFAGGRLGVNVPLPFSLFVHVSLWAILLSVTCSSLSTRKSFQPAPFLFAVLAMGITFPLLQVYCFGKTDYALSANTTVVFGARVYRNGKMSTALRDRVTRASALCLDWKVSRLIFSGGPGDGEIHETGAMRVYAVKMGVPSESIWVDELGLSTKATVINSLEILRSRHVSGRVIAVSMFYHLPRIKTTYYAHEKRVFTVPAWPGHPARRLALRSVIREVPAFRAYFERSVSDNVFI